MDLPATFKQEILQNTERLNMTKAGLLVRLATLGMPLSRGRKTLNGKFPARQWDSLLINLASIFERPPASFLGFDCPARAHSRGHWPVPLTLEIEGLMSPHTLHLRLNSLGLKVSPSTVNDWVLGSLPADPARLPVIAEAISVPPWKLVPTEHRPWRL